MASVTSCACAREGLGCLSVLVEPAHAVDQYSLHETMLLLNNRHHGAASLLFADTCFEPGHQQFEMHLTSYHWPLIFVIADVTYSLAVTRLDNVKQHTVH